MEQAITFDLILRVLGIIAAAWVGIKAVSEIINAINKWHDKRQKWDEMEDKMLKNLQAERDKIYQRYDAKLEEMEEQIRDNSCNNEAKFQEIKAELFILTECMSAVLAGLKEKGCNGPVTDAKDDLDEYLRKRAHE